MWSNCDFIAIPTGVWERWQVMPVQSQISVYFSGRWCKESKIDKIDMIRWQFWICFFSPPSFFSDDCRRVLSLHVKREGKESDLPTHHALLFNVNTSATIHVCVHLKQTARCFNSELICLSSLQQLSMQQLVFISSPPLSSCFDRILTTFHLGHGGFVRGWLPKWAKESLPPPTFPTPTRVEIKVVTSLITQSNLFPLLICTT